MTPPEGFEIRETSRRENPINGTIQVSYIVEAKPGSRLWLGDSCIHQFIFTVTIPR